MASFDVIFIGGGPAGYVGAIRCAQLGMSVAVVEREGLGGTCVLWGCIPAKALLESASLATKVSHAKDFGITVGDVKLDYGVAMKRSRAVSTQNSKGVEFLMKKNKITWIKGTGTLTGRKTISVTDEKGTATTHDAKKGIVICTGSRVKGLPSIGLTLDKQNILSSDERTLVLSRVRPIEGMPFTREPVQITMPFFASCVVAAPLSSFTETVFFPVSVPVPLSQVILLRLKRNSTPFEFCVLTARDRFMAGAKSNVRLPVEIP
jgi:hypothetical protein